LPVFAGAVFHSGAGGYGALLAAGGGGALVGALALSSARDIAHKGRVMLASAAALAASLALFALVSSLAVGAALLFVVGATSTCFTTMIATTIQLRTPAPLRGRVFSLYTSTLIGLPSLGALGLAAVAGAYGAPRAVLYAAAAFGIVLVVGARNVVRTRDRGD
jgi:MFS family permease